MDIGLTLTLIAIGICIGFVLGLPAGLSLAGRAQRDVDAFNAQLERDLRREARERWSR